MINLTARTPSFVSSSASANPGRTSHGYQDPGKSVASDDRTGKPVQPSQPDCTQEDYLSTWSSQEWKSGTAEHDRSGKPEENSWDSLRKVDPHREGAWDIIAEQMLLEFAASGHHTFRATTPLSRGQLRSKGKRKVSIHFTADQDTLDTIYRIILSDNQLSIYGAVEAFL